MIAAKNVYSTRRGLIVVDRPASLVRARATHARITVAHCENATSVGFDSISISIKYNFAKMP